MSGNTRAADLAAYEAVFVSLAGCEPSYIDAIAEDMAAVRRAKSLGEVAKVLADAVERWNRQLNAAHDALTDLVRERDEARRERDAALLALCNIAGMALGDIPVMQGPFAGQSEVVAALVEVGRLAGERDALGHQMDTVTGLLETVRYAMTVCRGMEAGALPVPEYSWRGGDQLALDMLDLVGALVRERDILRHGAKDVAKLNRLLSDPTSELPADIRGRVMRGDNVVLAACQILIDLAKERDDLRAEVARLQAGGCARDQGLTQFCVEAVEANERARRAVERANEAEAKLDAMDERIATADAPWRLPGCQCPVDSKPADRCDTRWTRCSARLSYQRAVKATERA